MKKKPTIADVAAEAGVSITTVSFVLNNRTDQVISEPVKKRVWRAAERLEYHPSASAAALARKRSQNVAIVFYKNDALISNQFYSFAIQGAVKEASARGYNLIFSYVDRDYQGYSDLPAVIRERNTEGVLFIQHVSPAMFKDIRARGIPCVAIDNHPMIPGLSSLQIGNRRGGELAADHLAELGHERIGVIVAATDRPSIAERAAGFLKAMAKHGVTVSSRTDVVHAPELSFAGGRAAATRILKKKRYPTAIFCANDEMAAGTLRAAHELGLRVPDDLSVIGFDGITMSGYTDPPLTTIDVDKERLGSDALAKLVELVETPKTTARCETVAVELLVRESTSKLRPQTRR